MNWRHALLNASALTLLLASGQALAADDLFNAPEVTISAAESGTQGFYLRGDLGYAGWTQGGDPSLRLFDAGTGATNSASFDANFDKPFSGSLGVGYQFNDIFRADLTGDYFEGDVKGAGEADIPCGGEAAGTTCAGSLGADYKAMGLMANGYVDIATVAGLTPYVGAGLGVTQLRWSDVALRTSCVPGAAGCSGSAPVNQSFDGDSSWRFTYALMAGVSYDMTERLKLDVGYRYSQIADGDIFGSSDIDGLDDGLGRHEIRAGLRLSLW